MSTSENPLCWIAFAISFAEVLVLAAKPAPDKGRPGKQRERQWRHGRRDDAFWGHLPLGALKARRRRLAGREAVDLVVVHEHRDVDVAPRRVQQVAEPLAVRVAISRVHDDRQVAVRKFYALCHRD